ncbi:MAG: methionyl-tRNA formyltransferase [Verrucomicrobia bacterium]|nr:methionyl-tRNA formyltransferase [Verrucomicrobiota bacterium]
MAEPRRHRLVLLGSDEIALPVFEAIAKMPGVEIIAVYSQPDRPAGRGQEIRSNPIAAWAKQMGLVLLQPERLTENDALTLKNLQVDLGVVMAYGQILQEGFLQSTRLGFINFHGSLLPALRGATPVEGALALGLKTTGVSLQQVVRRLDAGPLHGYAEMTINPAEGRASLRQRLGERAVDLAHEKLPSILLGQSQPITQDESRVTYTRRLTREDANLDFNTSASECAQRIAALEGWPGSTFPYRDALLKIGSAEAEVATAQASPGTILSADDKGLRIACQSGVLVIKSLQKPGGKMLPVREFLAGHPVKEGEVLPSRPMPVLVSPHPFPRVSKA